MLLATSINSCQPDQVLGCQPLCIAQLTPIRVASSIQVGVTPADALVGSVAPPAMEIQADKIMTPEPLDERILAILCSYRP